MHPSPLDRRADERRLLTVMFCDMVGSTALSEELDAEALRDVVRSYQEIGSAAVESVGGHVAQYLGDGLLVYFGWPLAYEDDAARAVRAGLRVLQGLAELNNRLGPRYGVRLSARVGIQTGPAVLGRIGSGDATEIQAFGAAPNIAHRIQSTAESDTIWVGEATAALVEGLFDLTDFRDIEVRGIRHPLRIARVRGERKGTRRFSVAESRGLTPLVGREAERERLRSQWTTAVAGGGASVLLTGDAGIGKSRLVHFVESLARDSAQLVISGQCSDLTRNSPLAPIRSALHAIWSDLADPLEHLASVCAERAGTDVPLLADLAGLPCPREQHATLDGWTPQRTRQATMVALAHYLEQRACAGPVLLIVEDLHWADPSTLELLALLQPRESGGGGVLQLFTARRCPPDLWEGLDHIELHPLTPEGAVELVEKTAREVSLPAPVVARIAERTDGIPLFVEELTKAVVQLDPHERDVGRTMHLTQGAGVPNPLYGSLMSRIDSLGPDRTVLHTAALIGREIDLPLLQAATGMPPETVVTEIERLVRAELVRSSADGRLSFRHMLLQEAAAATLVTSERRLLETRIASALLEGFPARAADEPERVAHHLAQGGQHREAITWWKRAGISALQRSANLEAIAHLRLALESLPHLTDDAERRTVELDLRLLLGTPLALTRGWAHPEVGSTYERANDLCEEMAGTAELPPRIGLTTYYLVRGQFRRARRLAELQRDDAAAAGNGALELEAEHDLGTSSHYLGEYARALAHLDRVEAVYDPSLHGMHAWQFGKDPLVVARVHRAMSLVCIGAVDGALAAAAAAVEHGTRCGHPFSHLWALIGVAIVRALRGETLHAAEVGEEIVRQAEAQGFPNWFAQGQVYVGLGRTVAGDHDKGIETIRQGLRLWEFTGAELGVPALTTFLGRALLIAGRAPEARTEADRAMTTMRRTEERWTEPELLRLRGDVEAELTGPGAAIPYYEAALARARSSGARTFELAAAISLTTALASRGGHDDPAASLRHALDAMTEGADLPSRRQGRALLQELALLP